MLLPPLDSLRPLAEMNVRLHIYNVALNVYRNKSREIGSSILWIALYSSLSARSWKRLNRSSTKGTSAFFGNGAFLGYHRVSGIFSSSASDINHNSLIDLAQDCC